MRHEDPDALRREIREALWSGGGLPEKAAQRLNVTKPFLHYLMRHLKMNHEPTAMRKRFAKKFTFERFDGITQATT